MNRRSFFKILTGFAAGIVAAFAPSKAKELTVADIAKARDILKANERTGDILVPANPDALREWHKSTPMDFVIQDERDLLKPAHYEDCSPVKRSGQWTHIAGTYSDNTWKFYVNGEEVDSSRAVDENGGITWPFQGAKKGDLCMAKSPMLSIYSRALKPTEIKKLWNS